MTKIRPLAFLAALTALAVAPLWTTRVAAQSARAKEIGTHIKCLCKGCDMTAGGCAHPGGAFSGPCENAKSELREIDEHLANGESEQQIIDAFVRKYGTIAYVEPPKHGFGLVAWLMPVVYSLVGLSLVVLVVKKWASRRPTTAAAGSTSAHDEAFERARARAARDTED
jgi:cytochrome c-type biogenesis protein CcmH/NrfF